MKTLKLILGLILVSSVIKSQEAKPRYEFGSTLLTVNSLQNSGSYYMSKVPLEYINGILFTYRFNRFSVRFLTSYSDNTYSYTNPPEVKDGVSQNGQNKDFRIGFGAQYSLLKSKEWLYAYADVLYRNVYSTGNTYGGIGGANSFTSNSNGIDNFFGIGFKLKVFKQIYLSPELGINATLSSVEETVTPMFSGNSNTNSNFDFNLNNTMKLHLTVKF